MDTGFLVTSFVTLFVLIDPIGLAPLFIALTPGIPVHVRRRIGFRALGIAAMLLALFAIAGDKILHGIGITLPAFRIAGGVLLLLTALDMLFERRTERREGQTREGQADGTDSHDPHDPSVFPLATPLIAGPSALAAMVLLAGENGGSWGQTFAVIGVMAAVLGVTALLFEAAGPLARALGRTGIMVVTRLLGMLLAALAIQFILDGLAGTALFAR